MTPFETAARVDSALPPASTNGAAPPPLPVSTGASPRAANAIDPAAKAEARRRVTETVDAQRRIADDLGISRSVLSRWIKDGNWPRSAGAPKAPGIRGTRAGRKPGARAKPPRRRAMIDRLLKAFARQVAAIETRLWAASVELVEKDARTLGVLAKTLETLIALDRDDGAKVKQPEHAGSDALDADLAERIRQWAEGGEGA